MKNTEIIKGDFLSLCTGCGACKNVCPTGAIELKEGYHTFLYPEIDEAKCINCQKCSHTCPVNDYSNFNNSTPSIYALKASDAIREKSSSGGAFTVMAEAILKNNGTCYGVTLTEDQVVKHIRIDSKNDIQKCQGSKYVQSDTGFSYQEVKKDLDSGKEVLFTGCPCQVAGLKKYLGRVYDNLVTVDIVCHGVPSQKLFDMYLQDKSPSQIKDVKFRDKKNGWRSDILTIEYKESAPYVKSWREGDAFVAGFQENIILRDSCQNCKFCEFPRTGDLSIGDFWGIEKYLPVDTKGTSIMFVNNNKGSSFFERISKKFDFIKEFDIPLSSIKNRTYRFYPHHQNKDLFFENIKTNSFSKSIENAKKGLYDVGIVGIPTVENFGGSLTYVGLYYAVRELGFSAFMIERPTYSLHPPANMNKNYYASPFKNARIVDKMKTKAELATLNDQASCFLVGSDQLFHHNLYNNFSQFVTLDWVKDNKRKVAYAASFGHSTFTGDDNERSEMSYYMKKFDAFSVREDSAVSLAKNEFGVDAVSVLDPVFLCDSKVYEDIASLAKKELPKHYISSYMLDPNNDKSKLLSFVEKRLGMPALVYSEMFLNNDTVKTRWDRPIEIGNINERMANLLKSDFIVTDSFHGTCFAIIMRKPFIAIKNKGRGVARFESILGKLNLLNRLISPEDDISGREDLFSDIDYDKVYEILNKEIEKDKTWLKNSIVSENKKSYSCEDIIIKKLRNENAGLRKTVSFLLSFLDLDYISEYNIYEYLNKIARVKDDIIIIITAKDTPGMSINADLQSKLYSIGIKTDLTDKHWCGYYAIINGQEQAIEKCKYAECVEYSYNEEGVDIRLKSAPLHAGNVSSVIVNGVEASMNSRGLNFVIIDKATGKVTDSVCFDTHHHTLRAKRK